MLLTRIRELLRNQWAGLLAVFLVLTGGSAYALSGSNTVFSDDITNGEVKRADVGTDAIASLKVLDHSLTAADLAPGVAVYGSGALDNFNDPSGPDCTNATNCPLIYNHNVISVTNPETGKYCIKVAGATPSNAVLLAAPDASTANSEALAMPANTEPVAEEQDCGAGAFEVDTAAHGVETNSLGFTFTVVP